MKFEASVLVSSLVLVACGGLLRFLADRGCEERRIAFRMTSWLCYWWGAAFFLGAVLYLILDE